MNKQLYIRMTYNNGSSIVVTKENARYSSNLDSAELATEEDYVAFNSKKRSE